MSSSGAIETAATAIIGALHGRTFLAHLMKRSWAPRSQIEFLAELARLLPAFALDSAQPPVWRARGDVRGLLSLPLVVAG